LRASELLSQFEKDSVQHISRRDTQISDQLPLFGEKNPLRDALFALDIETISPIEAINILYKWKKEFDS